MSRSAESWLGTLALLLLALPGSAQAAPLTEDALVARVLTKNPDYRAAQWETDVAEAGVKTATAFDNPVLRLEWLHAQNGDPLESGFGGRLSWRPPQPWEWSARRAAARAHTTEVREELRERAADLEASVRDGCATAGALGEQLAVATRAVETRRAILAIVEQRVERGASTRIEQNAARLAAARAEQDRDALAVTQATVLRQLAALAAFPEGEALELAPLAPVDAVVVREREAGSLALAQRPLLRADAARLDAATATLRAERTKRYPWFAFSSLPRLRWPRGTDDSSVDVQLGLDITLPIFDQNTGKVAAAEAVRQQQVALHLAHVNTVRRDVEVARDEVARRSELVERQRRDLGPILEEHATLLRDALQGRQLDFLALLNAEDVVVRTQREFVEAELAQRRAIVRYRRAAGELAAAPTPR